MKFVIAFVMGALCGAATLVYLSCMAVGKMADEEAEHLRWGRTRADWFRGLNDEDLAAALLEFTDSPFCKDIQECADRLDRDEEIPERECIACVLRYIQEVPDR